MKKLQLQSFITMVDTKFSSFIVEQNYSLSFLLLLYIDWFIFDVSVVPKLVPLYHM